MIIICPNCGFERDVSISAIPAKATKATCPKCKVKFDFRDAIILENPNEQVRAIHDEDEDVRLDISQEGVDKSELFLEDEKLREDEKHEAEIRNSQNQEEQAQNKNQEEYKELSEEEEELLKKAHEAYREQLRKIENLKKQGYILQALSMVPWESSTQEKNVFQKFFQTIVQILFSAPAFFATMFRPFPVNKALIFYLIVSFVQFLARYFTLYTPDGAEVLLASGFPPEFIEMMGTSSFMLLALFIAPLILFLQFMVASTLLFSIVKLVQPQSADFNHIARIFAYASAPAVLSIVPIIGSMIALPWTLYNIVIAVRFGLHLSVGKTFLSVSAFCLFCVVLLGFFTSMLVI